MHSSLKLDQLYVTVDILILTEKNGVLNLLLSKRSHPPAENRWALPGRFISLGDSAEDTVKDLLREMLPVKQYYFEQLYTFTRPERDPRGRVLSIAYLAIIPWQHLQPVLNHSDITLKCFSVSTSEATLSLVDPEGNPFPESELAFDHAHIIRTGITRLQGKIEYTDIGFHFLNTPQAFFLSEMQRIYEAVLGRAQDASNFRRFLRSRYEDTGKITPSEITEKKGRGRPAVLYSWDPQY